MSNDTITFNTPEVLDYIKFTESLDKLQEVQLNLAKPAIKAGLEEIFIAHPLLDNFSWKAFYPYFNDGDPCLYRAHTSTYDFIINAKEDDSVYIEEGTLDLETGYKGEFSKANEDEQLPQFASHVSNVLLLDEENLIREKLEAFFELFDNDILEKLYGEHVEVSMCRDGTTIVSEYTDHD